MQLTRFDRWLKERFIYETHIFTLRLPDEPFPKGVEVQEVEQNKGGDYRHRLIIGNNKLAEEVVAMLKQGHIMHATHVVEGKHWYNPRISPSGKSFTFLWILRFFSLVLGCVGAYGIYKLSQNEKLVKMVTDTINELKGGM